MANPVFLKSEPSVSSGDPIERGKETSPLQCYEFEEKMARPKFRKLPGCDAITSEVSSGGPSHLMFSVFMNVAYWMTIFLLSERLPEVLCSSSRQRRIRVTPGRPTLCLFQIAVRFGCRPIP